MARSPKPTHQLHRDRINAVRMVDRLDETTRRLNAGRLGVGKGKERAEGDDGNLEDAEKEDGLTLDHWQLKALQTTVQHARTLLADLQPAPSGTTSSGGPPLPLAEMQVRLSKAEERVKVALAATPRPSASETSQTPRFTFSPPPAPAFPPPTTLLPPVSSPEAPALIPISDDESRALSGSAEPFSESARPRSHSASHPDTITFPPPPPKAQTKNVEKVLSSQRNTQEELTSELSTMASQLRKNAEHFGTLLAKDRTVIESAADSLDGNLGRMQKEGGRLGKYSTRARGTTCWTILAVAMVGVAWTVMFIIIRVT